ncbi:MAG: radical SAM protein [Colwellia sp.]|nr:radical SAM protein [Colwellia sp.]
MSVWSKYNYFLNYTNNSYLLYNSRTGALIKLDNMRGKQLLSGNLLDDDLFDFLYKQEFIVDDKVDELALITEKNKRAQQDNSYLSITVELTESCNFRCQYCYQDHNDENIINEVEEGILKYLSARVQDLKVVQLNWFGGEPLLRLNEIKRISNKVKDYLCSKGIEYKQHMTTNGYLLTRELASDLFRDGLDNIQITLDGGKISHDKTRVLISGKGTYDRVLNGCKNAVDAGMELIVRMNLTKENYHYVEDMLASLQKKGIGPAEAIIHLVRAVDHGNIDDSTSNICFSIKEFGDIWPETLKIVARYGFSLPSISPVSYNCPFDLNNAVMIGRDGSIRLCSSTDAIIGSFDTEAGSIKIQQGAKKYKHRNPTADKYCKDCKCLPLCMGGCSYLEGRGEEKCNPERYAIEDLVKLYAEQNLFLAQRQ